LELFSGKKNLNNEIIILSSYSLLKKVIAELNLGISYYQHGFLQTNEVFGNSPFKIIVDSSHLQLTGIHFQITPLNNEEFTFSASASNQHPYNILSKNLEKSVIADIDINKKYTFNSLIETEFYSFIISKSNHFNIEKIIESEKYLKYVDQGRKKGTYAPVKAISDWVRVKNITFPNAVYLINRKIFKEGIKPTNVIRDTTKLWRVNQTFKREYEEIMAKDMEEILSFSMDELASDKPTKSRLGKIFETIKNYFS
jgi:hypothetical protein